VYENRVLRGIFGPKRDEIIGGLSKVNIEKLHNVHYSTNIIRMVKSRKMRWVGNVAYTARNRIA
jgi:hypothetical protein